jgi:hypothetical protein
MDTLIAGKQAHSSHLIGIARNGAGGLDTAAIDVAWRGTAYSMAPFKGEDSDIVN